MPGRYKVSSRCRTRPMKRAGKPQAARFNLAGFSDSVPIVWGRIKSHDGNYIGAGCITCRCRSLPGSCHVFGLRRRTPVLPNSSEKKCRGLEQRPGEEITAQSAILGRSNVGMASVPGNLCRVFNFSGHNSSISCHRPPSILKTARFKGHFTSQGRWHG